MAWVGVERDETDATRFWAAVMDALRGSGAIAAGRPARHARRPRRRAGRTSSSRACSTGSTGCRAPVLLVLDDLHELRSAAALERPRAAARRRAGAAAHDRASAAATRSSACTGCGSPASCWRSAPPTCTSPPRRRASCWPAAGVAVGGERRRPPARAHRGLGGRPAPGRAVARPPRRARRASSPSSPAASARSPTTCSTRCSPASRPRCARCCCAPASSSASAARSPTLLTGRSDGARLLHELEEANALVVAVDVARTWFRYHHLLADLLRLELRREAPDERRRAAPARRRLARRARARGRGDPPRRSSAATGSSAGELLGRHWVHLLLDGEEATLGALLAGLPAERIDGDAELATIAAADLPRRVALGRGRRPARRRAARAAGDVPAARRHRAETALASVQLLRARRVGDLGARRRRGDRAACTATARRPASSSRRSRC